MTHQSNKGNYEQLAPIVELVVEDLKKLRDIIDVAQRGLNVTKLMPNVLQVIIKVQGNSEADQESLKNTERIAAIADGEIQNGFPFLHSQASLMFYSYLEGAIKRLVTTFFSNNELLNIKELASIKIGLSEYLNLDENERLDYLFTQFEKSNTTGMQYGVTRFEKLLEPIGLGGPVDEVTSKAIFELSQIRNNILHRGSIADRHLIRSCPWLNYKIGDRITVSNDQYNRYLDSILDYIILLTVRIGTNKGIDMSEFTKQN